MSGPAPHGSGSARARAARSTLWSAVENAGLALVSFGALVVYARFLGPADFGLFSIVLALVELGDVLVSMLFHDALVQREDVSERHFDTAFTGSMALALVLFGACWLGAPAFARVVHHQQAARVLAFTALRFPFTALGAIIVARQRRDLAFRVLALRSLVGRLFGAGLGIGLVVLGAGIWGLVAQQVAIAAAASLVLWLGAGWRPRLRFGRRELVELVRFGLYAVGALFVSFTVKRAFTIIAGVMLGNERAGFLNIAFRAVDVLWAIAATAVSQVSLPVLARLQSDPQRLRRAYEEALGFACLLLYPCFCGIALVAPEAVTLLFGARWLASAPFVTVLALLVLVQAPRLLMTPALTAVGKPGEALAALAVELVVVLGLLAAFGAHTLSLSWAVGIWVAREIASLPIAVRLVGRATGVAPRVHLSRAAGPLLASACMAAAIVLLRRALPPGLSAGARLGLLAPVGAVVFIAGAWTFDRSSSRRLLDFVGTVARPSPKATSASVSASMLAPTEAGALDTK